MSSINFLLRSTNTAASNQHITFAVQAAAMWLSPNPIAASGSDPHDSHNFATQACRAKDAMRFQAPGSSADPNRELICSVSGDVVPMHRSLGGRYWREHVFAEVAGTKSQESLAALSCDTVMQLSLIHI